jgi:hypothetical protein
MSDNLKVPTNRELGIPQRDVQSFQDKLHDFIHKEAKSLTYAEVVGVLEVAKLDLWAEANQEDLDEEGAGA